MQTLQYSYLVMVGTAARLLGVSTQTLRTWERTGALDPAVRTAEGVRLYDLAAIEALAATRAAR